MVTQKFFKRNIFLFQKIANITTQTPLSTSTYLYWNHGKNCSSHPNSPKEFVNSAQIYNNRAYQVVLGIVVENYSSYKLLFPTSYTHGQTRVIKNVTEVPEKESDMIHKPENRVLVLSRLVQSDLDWFRMVYIEL